MPDTAQVDLQSSARIDFANTVALETLTTPWIHWRVRGDTLNNILGGVGGLDEGNLIFVGSSDKSSRRFQLFYAPTNGLSLIDSANTTFFLNTHSGTDLGSYDAGTMYDCLLAIDNGTIGVPIYFAVYADGDFLGASPLGQYYRAAGTPNLGGGAGLGCLTVGNTAGPDNNNHPFEQIIGKVRVSSGNSAATYDGNLVFDAELEEGSGSAVSPSGTISGVEGTDFSWITGTGGPDHGVVTLTPSSIALGGTSTASVVWYDSVDNSTPSSPQPSTTWSIVNDSQAATVDAGGTVTGAAPGTATVRAVTGAKNATADITVVNPYIFSGTITIS